jgi:hypothetical protein
MPSSKFVAQEAQLGHHLSSGLSHLPHGHLHGGASTGSPIERIMSRQDCLAEVV